MSTPEDVQRILSWPRDSRSSEEVQRLVDYRISLHHEMRDIIEGAERFDRDLTDDEGSRFAELQQEYDELGVQVPSRK